MRQKISKRLRAAFRKVCNAHRQIESIRAFAPHFVRDFYSWQSQAMRGDS